MSMGEYEHEPVRGLPEYLPDGEKLVWQGSPTWRTMARRVFHVRTVTLYFLAIIAVHGASQLYRGEGLSEVLLAAGWQVGLGASAVAILAILARAYARSTVYTLTDKRLVMRFGVALPMMINIPLEIVTSADLRSFSDGSGDIILTLDPKKKLSYMMLWPNLRSWHFRRVQPALRSIADVRSVAAAMASVVNSGSAGEARQSERNDGHLGSPAMAGLG
jgi:hypothetical protein